MPELFELKVRLYCEFFIKLNWSYHSGPDLQARGKTVKLRQRISLKLASEGVIRAFQSLMQWIHVPPMPAIGILMWTPISLGKAQNGLLV